MTAGPAMDPATLLAGAWVRVIGTFGLSPRDIDDMTLQEFGLLAASAGRVERQRMAAMAGAARLAQAKPQDWKKAMRDLTEE